ncbi:MAG: DNA repair protein RecO [Lentisphaeraceae bacterium]|nr:DNA repair protein RecO [Lentisphaeraceae bacterium]
MDTELIILRTVNYGETSLILHCLSPDLGRISVMARGAKKLSKKAYPEIGLFRVYSASLSKTAQGDMYNLTSVELQQQNDRLASSPSLIEFSGAFSQFSLSGSFEEVPSPVYYYCLIDCLQKIETNKTPINGWISRLIVTYLMEQGLFPDIQLSQQQKTIINTLLDKNSNNLESLDLKEDQWRELKIWTLKIAVFSEIDLPKSPCFNCC